MSAYVVEDETINRVVSWLNIKAMAGNSAYPWDGCSRPLVKLGYKLDTELGCKRLAEEMFTLNCDAIEQRYGPGSAVEFRPLDFAYKFMGFEVTAKTHQAIKSLRCFLYQCSEGDVPETSELYKALDTLSLQMAFTMVSTSDKYEAAKWD